MSDCSEHMYVSVYRVIMEIVGRPVSLRSVGADNIRDALGISLRRILCTRRVPGVRVLCNDCHEPCGFPALFVSREEQRRPFALCNINPDAVQIYESLKHEGFPGVCSVVRHVLNPGETFSFEMTILGAMKAQLFLYIQALMRLRSYTLHHVRLKGIYAQNLKSGIEQRVFVENDPYINNLSIPFSLKDAEHQLNGICGKVRRLTVNFHSQIRLKKKNRFFVGAPDFHTFFSSIIDRVIKLNKAYWKDESFYPPMALQERAFTVRILRDGSFYIDNLSRRTENARKSMVYYWLEENYMLLAAFSAMFGTHALHRSHGAVGHEIEAVMMKREKKGYMNLNGFAGKVVYEGEDLRDYLPYLIFGQYLQIGKNTTMGCGKYSIAGVS